MSRPDMRGYTARLRREWRHRGAADAIRLQPTPLQTGERNARSEGGELARNAYREGWIAGRNRMLSSG